MSHFASVFDMVSKESFCMGKEVGETWKRFDMLLLAGTEGMPFEEFMSVSSEEWRKNGPTPGMRAYYEWLRGHPAANFKLLSDAEDHPSYAVPEDDEQSRWWPIRGSVWNREGDVGDWASRVGYLHLVEGSAAAKFLHAQTRRSGSMEKGELERLFEWIQRVPGRRGEAHRLIANFPADPCVVNLRAAQITPFRFT